MSSVLSGLRDVEGVFGSFVLGESGELVAKDLPAVFDESLFLETGPRITRLCEVIEYGGGTIDTLALRFEDHRLHVRRANGGFLCVIASTETNGSALRMAVALVARRLPRAAAAGVPSTRPSTPEA